MLPRPLSHPHHLLVRLASDGELARTRTAAPERSQSRLTSHGARDDTRHRSSDISRLRARTHALPCAPSCTGLSSGSDLTLRSGSPPTPPTYARSQPNLPTAELQQPQAARRGWSPLERIEGRMGSRPSRLPRLAQVVEVVDLSVGDVPSSRPIGAGPCWSCRGGSTLLLHARDHQRSVPLNLATGP